MRELTQRTITVNTSARAECLVIALLIGYQKFSTLLVSGRREFFTIVFSDTATSTRTKS